MYARHVALEEKCLLVATIDDAGDTIINQLQIDIFENELNKLKKRIGPSHKVLDQLHKVAHAIDQARCQYIWFMGN